MKDEWSELSGFLTEMIEKYAGDMELDSLPDPDSYFRMNQIRTMYKDFMLLKNEKNKKAEEKKIV